MEYSVIDYYDVWYNVDEGYCVNDLARTDFRIDINDDDTTDDIISKLVSIDYLVEDAIGNVNIDWYDNMCELFDSKTGAPICRLEAVA